MITTSFRLAAYALALSICTVYAQTPSVPAPQVPAAADQTAPKGQILIQSHGEPPGNTGAQPPKNEAPQRTADENSRADVSDAERSAIAITAYDLDARMNLQRSGLSVRARVELRNTGSNPLKHIAMQLSSSLQWESATLIDGNGRIPLALSQHRLDTDADHTGAATEAILSLPAPLAPGSSASLDLFYSGTVQQSGGRLARLGANQTQQQQADWDAISPEWTGLRGFGNVLWYPVASPQLFMAESNTLFTAVGRARLSGENTRMRLRLSVEYTGEPPVAAYFCGRRAALKSTADDPDAPVTASAGIASTEFAAEPLGFRTPSLFVIQRQESLLGGTEQPEVQAATADSFSSSSITGNVPAMPAKAAAPAPSAPFLAVETEDTHTLAGLETAANRGASLLTTWLGPRPLSAVTVLDHSGQAFEDGPLLIAPVSSLETSPEAQALVYSLTHGWVQTGQPWMDEGVAQFFALLWVEREQGRDAALTELNALMQPVALAEPEFSSKADLPAGQSLVGASDDLLYRRKGASVWWMLRDLVGEAPLRSALSAWCLQPPSHDSASVQAVAFEHLLERLSGKDLKWFFDDWVLRDRGLPDLTIVSVETSQTPAGAGHNTGWLVAITVKNEGGAVADVPLIVRSGSFSTTQRVRVPGLSQVTQRVLVESAPTQVAVNDGGTPELRASVHIRDLNPRPQP